MDLMTYALCKGNGGGSGGDNRFIVTCTPTAQDFSGTMDKTVAEIYEAYQSGMKIVFRVMTTRGHVDLDCTTIGFAESTYPSFNGYMIDDVNNVLIYAYTGTADIGTWAKYSTRLYPLTPLS